MVKKPRFRSNPEATIQRKTIDFLRKRGWYVKATHGNAYFSGFPDLFCWHTNHGLRLIDLKVAGRCKLTKAQIQTWPEMAEFDCGVWIMVDATEEEYAKLFESPNFRSFWKPSYDKYCRSVVEILDEFDKAP